MKVKHILCMFDYGLKVNTGFAKQSTEIVKAIKKAYGKSIELDIVAAGFVPDEIFKLIDDGMTEQELSNITEPIKSTSMYLEPDGTKVISAVWHEGAQRVIKDENGEDKPFFQKYNERGLYGQQLFCDLLEYNAEYNYDGIFIMQDMGVILPMIGEFKRIKEKLKKENKKQFKSVFYFPIDCEPPASVCKPDFLFFDRLITYTEFGKNALYNIEPAYKNKVSVIPHGINLNQFYRESEDVVMDFRQHYFKENANKFIVGIVNRNQFRKDFPTSIFAFLHARELAKKSGIEMFLYIHCYPVDQFGWNIPMFLDQTGLVQGIDYGFPEKRIRDIDTETLNMIYNSLDLYISTSLGEGFGLTAIECFATKTLTIIPNNTAYTELSGSKNRPRSITYDMLYKVCCTQDNIIREQGDYEEIGEMIININEQEAIKTIDNAYEFVKTLSWDKIGAKWVEVFKVY